MLAPLGPSSLIAAPTQRARRRMAAGNIWLSCIFGLLPALLGAAPLDFEVPRQPVGAALLAFSQQAHIEVLFSSEEMRNRHSTAIQGRYEPDVALALLLQDTGCFARAKGPGKFVVKLLPRLTGSLHGRLLSAAGGPAVGVQVALPALPAATVTDTQGEFRFPSLPPGTHRLSVVGDGFRPFQMAGLSVVAGRTLTVDTQTLAVADKVTVLEPFVVESNLSRMRPLDRGRIALATRSATGNLDLPRSENGPLPFRIYEREQIARSGVVNLSEFFALEVLDSEGAAPISEQGGSTVRNQARFATGGTNVNLRGFGADQTILLVNGRRLPESPPYGWGELAPPDVNFIPLSLVQQIEVLPVSASALYSGNAIGGVVNIVLRPDIDGSEVTVTSTNALRGFSAPQSNISLLHGGTLLGGALRFRLSATFTRSMPPTEAQLGYRTARFQPEVPLSDPVFRATPNLRSATGLPLFGPGTSSVTSVAPGADGTGGRAAFAGREGLRNFAWFETPGQFSTSPNSRDYAYGSRERRASCFGSVTYDLTPRLQLGFDIANTQSVVNRGTEGFIADLHLAKTSPLNPFGQDLQVAFNETAPRLGEDFSQVRIAFTSAVLGVLLKPTPDWRVTFDAQASRNLARYRGAAGADLERWQQLVDSGLYNPLRDTQTRPPPDAFYERVLKFYTTPGRFIALSDYRTLDTALRIANSSLRLPTGRGSVCLGGDYRRNHLGSLTEAPQFADGSPAAEPTDWAGRTLQRLSAFGELQAPVLPSRWLPAKVLSLEADVAARYVLADTSRESNLAPAAGLRVDFAGGLALRGSVATSNRYPTPWMSRLRERPGLPGGGGIGPIDLVSVLDPVRNETYGVETSLVTNPNLLPESAVTSTVGAALDRGQIHRVRLTVDFVNTRKVNEQVALDTQSVLDFEPLFPTWVERAPLAPGDPHRAGRVVAVTWGPVNLAWRHSQNWTTALDYAWNGCRGGTFEAYGRWIYFQKYERQLTPESAAVDQLRAPDGAAGSLLRHRANFGASWSNRHFGFGLDGHYFGASKLSRLDREYTGHSQLSAYWQFDAYLQVDIGRCLGWKGQRHGLRGQLRVNNLFNSAYPTNNTPTSPGVQPYGDWRGRVASASVTATF